WQAFALYRIGGTDELRTALEAIDQLKAKYPGARMQSETEALGVRIRGALAARGDATSAALVRTAAADSMLRCDREEQSVRAEALNALTQNDPAGAMPLLQKTLARKDACSAALRRTAVFLMGSKRAEGSQAALTTVARTDPSTDVRTAAIEWLARFPGEGSLGTIEELARDTADRVSRAATRALVNHPSPRARTLVRSLVERAETPERLRLEALSAFDRERATAEDVTWMRTLHAKTENPKIRARLVSTLSNIGGPEVDQWLLALSRDPEVDSDTRRTALRRVGRTLPIADLARTYDASAERSVREGVIDVLRERTEAEATDKLIDIVKRGTDPQLRSRAISALTSKKDPRTIRLLMEILDK
ncbi:MAG: HEAT repeat domain-containing protein, partial [Gemmatimonadetes bacterium]|nr:HEAT repeat domain-containing protein [Gemmatimonadota bacterium]